jgi:Fur family ferric uptake transcriptional regulator
VIPLVLKGSSETMQIKRIDEDAKPSGELLEEAKQMLREQLIRLGLKQSAQRDTILRVFVDTRDHLSTEELHQLVKAQDASIGYTTVYRTLKLFADCGLAAEVEFHDGVTRYEHSLNRRNHHHMVCTVCRESVEFFAAEIEAVEQAVGREYGYATTRHSFQIYGVCSACQQRQKDKSGAA